ncbi:hypothetical protein [Polaribacter glomeratus]|uniref:Uncharacterized protein n=1 Tax=Polaribacter glomeratus TaxID=102 RepID=A0A2S7WGM0_9FLAO|nr:hypothetical protein [Polaribacter glomeratus]PQJ76402.1 hypothetical protein BTO16_10840 [Polaribacter glomeratus]TXD65535.1 hypothetical protein ESX12_10145 [Polaribacter glomeratus]
MKSQILNIRISDSLKKDLDTLSEMNGESISDITRKALQGFVSNQLSSKSAIINDLEQDLDSEDKTWFSLSKTISTIHNNGRWLSESETIEIYNEILELMDDARSDNDTKEAYLNSFKKSKRELNKLGLAMCLYLEDLINPQDGFNNFSYKSFSAFLKHLMCEILEGIIILKVPNNG